MASVNVENLCVRLGSSEIIHNLSLEVQDREFLVLLGPSGCGKSTLLHSIAGLLEVADGHVEIGGQDMTWADPSERNIGMVFQSYALYPTMTVERNMSFGLRITGTPKDEIERRVARVAHMLQLESLLKRKPAQLSGGSVNAWPLAGPWCARRACFYLTSHCPTWMPNCAPSCAGSSNCCIKNCRQP